MWLSISGHISSYTLLNQAVPKQCQSKWKKINSTEIFMRATWIGKYFGLCWSPAPGGYKRLKSLTIYKSNQSCRELKMKSHAWVPSLTIIKFYTCALRKSSHFTLFIWNFPSLYQCQHLMNFRFLIPAAVSGKPKLRIFLVLSAGLSVALQIMKRHARFLNSCHFHFLFPIIHNHHMGNSWQIFVTFNFCRDERLCLWRDGCSSCLRRSPSLVEAAASASLQHHGKMHIPPHGKVPHICCITSRCCTPTTTPRAPWMKTQVSWAAPNAVCPLSWGG